MGLPFERGPFHLSFPKEIHVSSWWIAELSCCFVNALIPGVAHKKDWKGLWTYLCQDRRRKREGENPHTSTSSVSAKHETHSYQPYVQETHSLTTVIFCLLAELIRSTVTHASSSLESASSVTPRTSSLSSPWSHHSFPNPLCTTSASGSNPVNTPLG